MGAGRTMEMVFAIKGIMDTAFSSSTKTAAQNLRQMKSEASRLKDAIRETEQAQKNLDKAFKAGGMSEGSYKKALADMKESLKGYNTELAKAAQNQAAQAKQALQSPADSGGGGIGDMFGKVKGAALAVAPVVATLKEAVGTAMTFESAMADVRKVVDFDSPQQFKDMQADILNLTKTLPMAAEDIAKIVASGGQAGIAKEDLMGFAESAAKMGVAFDITAEQAGDMMAKWRTAFKMNQSDVVGLADKINYLGNTTAASAPLISDVVTRIGPLGEIGGVASGEIAALGASMVGTGVQSDVAATGIKNLILGMAAGEGATKSQAEAFSALGLSAADMAVKMQSDAKGAILEVLRALQQLPKEKQASVLADLFGKESIGAISPLLSNLGALEENFNKVADASKYAGSMEQEFQARCETSENSMQLLENAVQRTAINLGSLFLPALKDVAEGIAENIDKVTEFVQTHQDLLQNIAAAAGVVAVAVGAYKGFVILQTAIQSFSLLTTVIKGVTAAQTALNVVMSLNPIGIVVALIAALVAGLIYLWNTNEGFRNAVIAAWEEICNTAEWAFNTARDTISSAMTNIAQYVREKVDEIKQMWETLKQVMSHPIDAVVNFVRTGNVSGEPVAENARGGIYGKGAFLTTFAEDSPEAAIPLDGSARAESLWRQAGGMMGLLGESSPNIEGQSQANNYAAGAMNMPAMSLNIPVTINGNADANTARQMQQSVQEAVERALRNIQHQRERVSLV